ncbi:heavy-metal-associated domain-containing protein [Streptococcus pacificus]|uniref:Heavy-metal-associated domain-containing protein n=1 Tax=Streptococcus pacificus TaxID=2740577 RepID=A0ABS0ZGI4_9STRE|nr:heavy metal-associated domain-containing protein [Streptococcus pacificus]MBJ8325125.1 heavy-metal-associated domain-containing protein [Streptococcus pacificus]
MEKTYEMTGLKCQGCVDTVTEKLSALKSVENVSVNLDAKEVTITGSPLKWSLQRALKGTKFEIGKEVKK